MQRRTFTVGFIIDGESHIATCYSTPVKTRCYVVCDHLGFAVFNTQTCQPEFVSTRLSEQAIANMTTCVKLALCNPMFNSETGVDINIMN